MAYQNAFTIGACDLQIYKSFEAEYPTVGFALVDPNDYASNNITISEVAGVVSASFSGTNNNIFFFTVSPNFAVNNGLVRLSCAPSQNIQYMVLQAFKANDVTSLLYNRQYSIWVGSIQTQEISIDVTYDEETIITPTPNPVILGEAIAWNKAGYLVMFDALNSYSLTFTAEIDVAVIPDPEPDPLPPPEEDEHMRLAQLMGNYGRCADDGEDSLRIQHGDSLNATLSYQNEDGTFIDITGRTLSVGEASHPLIQTAMQITVLDAVLGLVSIYLPISACNTLLDGRSSWFRVACNNPDNISSMMSPKIWVNIQ